MKWLKVIGVLLYTIVLCVTVSLINFVVTTRIHLNSSQLKQQASKTAERQNSKITFKLEKIPENNVANTLTKQTTKPQTDKCVLNGGLIQEIYKWKQDNMLLPMRPAKMSLWTYKPNGHLVQCAIPKSMTTGISVMMGYMANKTRCESTLNGSVIDRSKANYWNCMKGLKNVNLKKMALGKENWTTFAIAREPINRFLSAWLDKCIARLGFDKSRARCYGCSYDLGCFIKNNYDKLLDVFNGAKPSGEQDHFFPWVWHCKGNLTNPPVHFVKYNRTSEFYVELQRLLDDDGVTQSLVSEILSILNGTTTNHATFGNNNMKRALNILKKRDDLYKILIRTYYYDYMEASSFYTLYPTFDCWLKNNEELKSTVKSK